MDQHAGERPAPKEGKMRDEDGGGRIKGGLTGGDVRFQLDPFHKNREITRKVKDEKQRETV